MLGQAGKSARPITSGPAYQAMVPPRPPPLAPPSQGGEKERTEIGMNSELVQYGRFISPGFVLSLSARILRSWPRGESVRPRLGIETHGTRLDATDRVSGR